MRGLLALSALLVALPLFALFSGCQKERIGPAHHGLYVYAAEGTKAEPQGGRVAVTTADGDVHTIRGTFKIVWEQADGTRTLGAILDDLKGRYPDQPGARIEGDLHNFVTHMVAIDVLELRPEAANTPAPPSPPPPG